jgi:pyruvate/2-oxoacid:ferredoxin oxidoreductase beta subunit
MYKPEHKFRLSEEKTACVTCGCTIPINLFSNAQIERYKAGRSARCKVCLGRGAARQLNRMQEQLERMEKKLDEDI